MSTDAERAATEKAEADKKAAEEAAAATKAAASTWPTRGYNSFIPLLLFSVLAMLALYIDLSAICVVCASLTEYQYAFICVNAMLVFYSWINLIEKLPIYTTILIFGTNLKNIELQEIKFKYFCKLPVTLD